MGRPLVILLALLASLCAAVGIVIRQRATREVPAEQGVSSVAIVATSFQKPSWWAGTMAAVAGYACQALALSKGSLLLVQPLMSSLLFGLPISADFHAANQTPIGSGVQANS